MGDYWTSYHNARNAALQNKAYQEEQGMKQRLSDLAPYYVTSEGRPASFQESRQTTPTNEFGGATGAPQAFTLQQPTPQDRLAVMQDEYSRRGDMEGMSKTINLSDMLAKRSAMAKSYGNMEQAYQLDAELDKTTKATKLLTYAKSTLGPQGVQAVLQKFPDVFKGIDVNAVKFGNGINTYPLIQNGQQLGTIYWSDAKPEEIHFAKMDQEKTQVEPDAYKPGHVQQFDDNERTVYREYLGKGQWKDRKDLGGGPRYRPSSGGGGTTGGYGGKPPIGYRFTQGGDLEPIPGGPADFKAQDRAKSQEGRIQAVDSAITELKRLIDHPGRKGATGTIRTSAIPGTAAAGFAARLDTFKSKMFVPVVEQMKGMGQLSDAEGKRLVESVGALDTKMPESEILQSMKDVMAELQQKKELAEKYQNTSGAGKNNKKLDTTTAQRFLRQAGGNKDKARDLARKAGYSF